LIQSFSVRFPMAKLLWQFDQWWHLGILNQNSSILCRWFNPTEDILLSSVIKSSLSNLASSLATYNGIHPKGSTKPTSKKA
jgi:hypothetical protein